MLSQRRALYLKAIESSSPRQSCRIENLALKFSLQWDNRDRTVRWNVLHDQGMHAVSKALHNYRPQDLQIVFWCINTSRCERLSRANARKAIWSLQIWRRTGAARNKLEIEQKLRWIHVSRTAILSWDFLNAAFFAANITALLRQI